MKNTKKYLALLLSFVLAIGLFAPAALADGANPPAGAGATYKAYYESPYGVDTVLGGAYASLLKDDADGSLYFLIDSGLTPFQLD